MTLGEFLRQKRTGAGLAVRRLARLSGVCHTEIKRIEDGVRKQPSPKTLRMLAEALNVRYEEFLVAAGFEDIINPWGLTPEQFAKVREYAMFVKGGQ